MKMAKRLMAASETEMVKKTRRDRQEMHEKRIALEAKAAQILGRYSRSFGRKGDAFK